MSALLFQSPICLPCYCCAQAVRSLSEPDPPDPPKPAASAAPSTNTTHSALASDVPGLYMTLRAPQGVGIRRA